MLEKFIEEKIKQNKNKYVIELCINSEIDLFNCYTFLFNEIKNENIKINEKIIDLLLEEVKDMPIGNSLIINVKLSDTVNCDINIIDKLIKDSIHSKIVTIRKKIKRLNLFSAFLAFFGMMLIGLTQVLNFFNKRFSINEFIIVMSWVFMWTAVDKFFFERPKLVKKMRKLLRIFYSEITLSK